MSLSRTGRCRPVVRLWEMRWILSLMAMSGALIAVTAAAGHAASGSNSRAASVLSRARSHSHSPVHSPSHSLRLAFGSHSRRGCPARYGSFSFTSRPPLCWQPYAQASPFYTAIGSHPQRAKNSPAAVEWLRRQTEKWPVQTITTSYWTPAQRVAYFTAHPSEDPLQTHDSLAQDGAMAAGLYGFPRYYATKSDPVYTVIGAPNSGCTGAQLRIPPHALPAGGSDSHLTVVDQTTGLVWDFWQFQKEAPGTGTHVKTTNCGKWPIDSSGLPGPDTGGAISTGWAASAGVIRVEELEAGVIPHALMIVLQETSKRITKPAVWSDGQSEDPNAIGEGMRLYLDYTDAEIAKLNIRPWQRAIFTAAAKYGLYVSDSGSYNLQFESPMQYFAAGQSNKLADFFSKEAKRTQKNIQKGTGSFSADWTKDLDGEDIDWLAHLHVLEWEEA